MAAHRNITTALPTGISLHTDAEADDVQTTSKIEVAELVTQATGEIQKVTAGKKQDNELVISGDGPHDWADVAAGTVSTVSDYEVIRIEVTDGSNTDHCKFSITATSTESFTDPAAEPAAAGAEPGIDDIDITSVEYTLAESVRRTKEVGDFVLVAADGTPAHRAREGIKNPFTIDGRGDLPAGVGLGTGGVAYKNSDTGITMVDTLMTGEKRRDWNRWSASGNNYPSAS